MILSTENGIFFNFNTQSVIQGIISKVCCKSKSRLSHSIVGLRKVATTKKNNNNCIEFKVHLIQHAMNEMDLKFN